ncbi:hypothetical protein CEXT_735011 [Caerostris extrusa]|uniref:Uncharacterized protein n=1 Tax=Caerostris extrusa TaxID=172846 RepID=A0AAV4MLQ7_CAEEX|nr:hypothetical protein CEXT_735011 [Caerostris extrusa]
MTTAKFTGLDTLTSFRNTRAHTLEWWSSFEWLGKLLDVSLTENLLEQWVKCQKLRSSQFVGFALSNPEQVDYTGCDLPAETCGTSLSNRIQVVIKFSGRIRWYECNFSRGDSCACLGNFIYINH